VPTFEETFAVDALRQIVNKLRNGHFDVIHSRVRIATGADRIDWQLFERDKDLHLSAIKRKVLSGRYTFAPFLETEIPKAESTEMRTISVASIRDTIVQSALYTYFYDQVDQQLIDSVYGYRRGRSAHDAVNCIRRLFKLGRTFVYDADLSKFFDRIDHERLMVMVEKLEIDPLATKLVFRYLKTGRIPSGQAQEHRDRKGNQLKYQPTPRETGVPQGGVLSGMLSNLYLHEFERTIRDSFAGIVRYADDFVVCCESETECRSVAKLVENELDVARVKLNVEKTKYCVDANNGVDFLGFRIRTDKLSVRGRNISKFKQRIRSVISHQKPYKTPLATLRSLINRIRLKIHGPNEEQLFALAELGHSVTPFHRSWIGFFRIADDIEQIRGLDRWIRSQISAYMWGKFSVRVTYQQMKKEGLPTLVNTLWRARNASRIEPTKALASTPATERA